MSTEMRKQIDKFKSALKGSNEFNLSDYLVKNNISNGGETILLFDEGKEKAFLHFDKLFYYIIYKIGNNFAVKKKEPIKDFDFKVVDNFGKYYITIKNAKAPLPISKELFGKDILTNLSKEIESKSHV